MSAAVLIAQLQQQRQSWCVLRKAAAGQAELSVCLRRPTELDLAELRRAESGSFAKVTLADTVCKSAVDWRGFTEAELLGASIGSSDPLPFDTDLWTEVVLDHAEWLGTCIGHIVEQLVSHSKAREEQQKN